MFAHHEAFTSGIHQHAQPLQQCIGCGPPFVVLKVKPFHERVKPDGVLFGTFALQPIPLQCFLKLNRVSNAVHLRFDVAASSLPDAIKQRLLAQADQRIASDGVVVIKAQAHRSLPQNQAEALARLQAMVDAAAHIPLTRRATRPTRASQRRRVEGKVHRGQIKAGRGKMGSDGGG